MKSMKALLASVALLVVSLFGVAAFAQGVAAPHHGGGEDSLSIPAQIDTQQFFGMSAAHLLQLGLVVSGLGIVFGMVIFYQLKNAPVHKSMLEVSELIYETCKTYLVTQAKFLGLLWLFIGAVIVIYYGVLKSEPATTVLLILAFSVVGIAGSATVALFGIRVNTFANSRTA
jgi:K(+)-stimulated pyrophosphate-energized sodium pump